MHILGLNIGHNSTACLVKDARVESCVSEERFSRKKNHFGVPFESINYILGSNNLKLNQIDFVVVDDQYPVHKNYDFSKQFINSYLKKSKLKKVLSYLGFRYPKIFHKYLQIKKVISSNTSHQEKIRRDLSFLLKYPKSKIIVIDHHIAHALSTCFNLPTNEKTLIFTLDGEGSGICASVNIWDGRRLEVISRTSKEASLGYFYAIGTMYLGMKPLEHEFKVMGLAPYAKEHNVVKVYCKLDNLIKVEDSLIFSSQFNMPFADKFFAREMAYERFDNVAGAMQKLLEEKVCEWVTKSINFTGISNIALAGGVFMNVKANQKVSEIEKVKNIFIMPSCGDESNSIGCAFYGYKKYCEMKKIPLRPVPIENLYLGPKYDNFYVKMMIDQYNLEKKYKIRKIKNINHKIACLLAEGKIVARCSGRSEWGARALGNRSILANPKNMDTIKILNETIKDRDFWMPFTPSILDKYEKKYCKNPKKIFSPYMIITFNSTKLAKEDLPAAMHPYDGTIRPQIVRKNYNKDYYEIIEKFSKMTGIGAVLNTSFNLHGEPNVLTPEDAIRTFDKSSLKFLAIENYLFEKLEQKNA